MRFVNEEIVIMRKVPFVPQFNSTECGVCVLTMILHYYGAYYPIYEIRKHLAAYRDGITIRRLISVFEYYGIKAIAYHRVIDNNLKVDLPAIITVSGKYPGAVATGSGGE